MSKLAVVCSSLTHRSAVKSVLSGLTTMDFVVSKDFSELKDSLDFEIVIWIDEDGSSNFLNWVRNHEVLQKTPVLLFSNHLRRDLVLMSRLSKLSTVELIDLPINSAGGIQSNEFRQVIFSKLKSFQTRNSEQICVSKPEYQEVLKGCFDAVLIGVSTGGPAALKLILPNLTARISHPIVIVQHMPEHMQQHYVNQMNKDANGYQAKLAEDGEFLLAKTIYVAPVGTQLRIATGVQRRRILRLHREEPINDFLPSADALFASGAKVLGNRCLALIMTGMGEDGKNGLKEVHNHGGMILAQDQQSSVVWGMPGAAVREGIADLVVGLKDIPETVENALLRGKSGSCV